MPPETTGSRKRRGSGRPVASRRQRYRPARVRRARRSRPPTGPRTEGLGRSAGLYRWPAHGAVPTGAVPRSGRSRARVRPRSRRSTSTSGYQDGADGWAYARRCSDGRHGSMAGSASGVGERLAGLGQEAPVVAVCVQGELQHTVRVGVAYLAVRLGRAELVVAGPARPDHELADAACGVEYAVRALRREALVVVVVAGEHYLGIRRVQRLEDRSHLGGVAMLAAGREQGLVPVRELAPAGRRGQVRAQPPLLCRSGLTPADLVALRVDDHDVPGTQGVGVVPPCGGAGRGAEVGEGSAGMRGEVLVVARRRRGTRCRRASRPYRPHRRATSRSLRPRMSCMRLCRPLPGAPRHQEPWWERPWRPVLTSAGALSMRARSVRTLWVPTGVGLTVG